MTSLKGAKFLRVIVVENFTKKDTGEVKDRWHEVGAAWFKTDRHGNEYVAVSLIPGVSLSGKFHIRAPLPPREDTPEEKPKTGTKR